MSTPKAVEMWNGAERFASRMAECGFRIPERFAAWTAGIAGMSLSDWNRELARHSTEHIRSGGNRSPDAGMEGSRASVLRDVVLNPDHRDRLVLLLEQWKGDEVIPDPFLHAEWSERRTHLRVSAQRVARVEGFRTTSKGYRIDVPGDMELDVQVDVGRAGSTVPQIAMMNRLATKDGSWSMWMSWGELLPGLQYYDYGKTSTALLWGVRAFVTAGREFAATFPTTSSSATGSGRA